LTNGSQVQAVLIDLSKVVQRNPGCAMPSQLTRPLD
jgi:hypothetical protein